MWRDKCNIRTLGLALFLVAALFCLHKLWNLNESAPPGQILRLKLVNVFTRHGDRKYQLILVAQTTQSPLRLAG